MSNYTRCKICGEYGWTDTHVCPPLWTVFEITGHEIGYKRNIYAQGAEEAVEEYAEREDTESASGHFLDHGGKIGLFRQDEPADILMYEVEGQLVPEYAATAIKDDEAVNLVWAERQEEGGIES
jgi:hypothetical protein